VVVDLGLTGKDLIEETGARVKEIAELTYSKQGFNAVKLVVAVPNSSRVANIKDLSGVTIATEYVNITKKYLKENAIDAQVEFSWGATESKPPILADAIVELIDTGRSLKANNLKIIATVLESTTRIITNEKSFSDIWKRQKIETITMLLKSALAAEEFTGLKMNVSQKNLKKIIDCLPTLRKPTISPLAEKNLYAVETIILKTVAKNIIPEVKRLGAEGIVEYPLNKVIY